MGTEKRANLVDAGLEPVVAWRVRRLRAAGLAPVLATEIAADCGYDLHALLDLIDRGCPADLAVRILAPLDATVLPC